MPYIVTKDGRKYRLDESDAVEADDWHWPFKKGLVAVVTDEEHLEKYYIVTVKKNKKTFSANEKELELLVELEFNHEPTEEELLYVHNAYGEGSANTYIFVNECYKVYED